MGNVINTATSPSSLFQRNINFEDMQTVLNNNYDTIIINTLEASKQKCLIIGTLPIDNETKIMNDQLQKNKNIINCHMETAKINNKLTYKYKLVDGISEVKGGIAVLTEMDYPKEIIDNTNI